MALVPFTVEMPRLHHGATAPGSYIVTWPNMLNGDDGAPFVSPNRADKSVQVLGTFGVGGTLHIEGTNKQSYVNGINGGVSAGLVDADYAILNDPQANALTFTAAKIEQVLENPAAVRPHITAGDGTTSLTVVMVVSAPITKF